MSNAYLSPILQDPQFNNDATFLAGGLIWFYAAETTTPILAYTGPDASIAWTNPIVLKENPFHLKVDLSKPRRRAG